MELQKRSLHMETPRLHASKQVVLEDNVIIPDTNKDADKLLLDRGKITIEEVSSFEDAVTVKGKLHFKALYLTEGNRDGIPVSQMEGSIPFEEKLQMEGLRAGEHVHVKAVLEELGISLINSRKLSVRAIMVFHAVREEVMEEDIPVALSGDEQVEYRRRSVEMATLAMKNQDIFPIKEEIEIPGSFPNIRSLVYWDAEPVNLDFRILDDKIAVQGELKVFCMYAGDGEKEELYHYETAVPFSGSVECPGCREGMIPVIEDEVENGELSIRPDYDGEERILFADLGIRIFYCIYEEENVEMIGDVYGVSNEVEESSKPITFRRLLARANGKCKVSGHFKAGQEGAGIYRVIHTTGDLILDEQEETENGIRLSGQIKLRILYEDSNEDKRFGVIRGVVPFEYLLEAEGMMPGTISFVQPQMEQIAVSVIDTDEVDVKCVILFRGDLFTAWEEQVAEQITLSPLDLEKQSALPGIAVYRMKDGESLWDIGKRYYVSIETLMQTNNLTSQEVRPGEKILIVK